MIHFSARLPLYPRRNILKKNSEYFVKLLLIIPNESRPVWYMCLKIENCCLKIFVEIRVGKKMCGNT